MFPIKLLNPLLFGLNNFNFRLELVVRRGEQLLEQIQNALADIAQSQLDMERSQATCENSPHHPET